MQAAAIDPAAYSAMKTTVGEIFSDVIDAFLGYVPGQIDQLDHAIEAANCDDIFNLAHSIKSSCSSIGALGLANTAEQIEQLGRQQTTTGTTQLYQLLQHQFSEVVEFLKQDSIV